MKFILIFFIVIICQSQTVNVVALRVDFVADNSEFTTGNGKFDLRNPDPDSVQQIIIDPPPHNRLYFEDHLKKKKN
ncbi:MAG: hypothetical protein KDD94_06770, partial [Calditrichaeota bacterium]|nr:hypothetical protein [Calditrichota bacterium]